jgi:hypothetical protein
MKFLGGARVGWAKATWPFAMLTCSKDKLRLFVFPFGGYDFAPDQVKTLEEIMYFPLIGMGIRINHNVNDYPEKIIFWSFRTPGNLLRHIRETGFMPSGVSYQKDEAV